VANHPEFAPLKKRLQHLGSAVVRRASSTDVPDTTSGFRAYNREAALQLQVVGKYTYTLESIIQAGRQLVAIDHVPIRVNPKTRDSRLFASMGSYVRRNAVAIFRVYAMYEPLRVFMTAAAVVGIFAGAIFARFLYFYFGGEGAGHVQSLILGAVLINVAAVLAALGVMGDLLAGIRNFQQRTLERVRRAGLVVRGRDPELKLDAPRAAGRPATTGADAGPDPDDARVTGAVAGNGAHGPGAPAPAAAATRTARSATGSPR
jgi:hypothetical protein